MSRRRGPLDARSADWERAVVWTAGLLGVAIGLIALLTGGGLFGVFRGRRPLADPLALDWLGAHPTGARTAAILLGLLLLLTGVGAVFIALRPEHHPDLVFTDDSRDRLVITASAVAEAVRADAEAIPGVSRARAAVVGSTRRPTLRLTLALREGSDLPTVWTELDRGVVERARRSLGVSVLPAAVHLEFDAAPVARVT
ncbi:Asp23/Gls24 family envelope stress response protein [Actinoalloteichus fjordicus]|uniref:Alkaline shock response membrane anchor protein AmaP n=1 Tax=Actinoalloteichus fjordicus TaxID=1612552 RepID=A0AAC9LG59_9PSEU|nr:hypothetical protein [Actinoalloteichus fjordicus]APU16751.1 hypothetical protein UA74_23665 [Actinoalloteichus fjordicus]